MLSLRQWLSSRRRLEHMIRICTSAISADRIPAYRRMYLFIPSVPLSTNSFPQGARTCSIRPRTIVASGAPPRTPTPGAVISRGLSTSISDYEIDEINEDEIEEQFVRGSGPGGQKINKTASCVVSGFTFQEHFCVRL